MVRQAVEEQKAREAERARELEIRAVASEQQVQQLEQQLVGQHAQAQKQIRKSVAQAEEAHARELATVLQVILLGAAAVMSVCSCVECWCMQLC